MSNPAPARATFAMTLHVRDHCLCLHTQRAARALARHFDDALRPVGITGGQFSLLISLNRPEPPTIGSVADLLAMDRTTLTAAVKVLEGRGLLTTTPDARDRRAKRLTLTPAGLAVLERAVPVWEASHGALGIEGTDLCEALDGLRDAALAQNRKSSASSADIRTSSSRTAAAP
ncbi:MarR family winged helix-turn-helix transcriptional regulator [Falsirhodobacter xinxiangensis]|uniref:MarR family winged helix-turn-helix transcriptional regulator n=1 Tax=Falsirhodobacter xinxiangensis TaxID=2530049 RepID=UPI0010AB19C5|nr:MarR family winged helix-turn-helix transcriptional regulator [Rhodobacter xinxiangensis]